MRLAALPSSATDPTRPSARGRIAARLGALGTSAVFAASVLGTVGAAPAAAVVVPAPAAVEAQGLTDTHVQVLWSPVAGATSYDVYRGVTHVGVSVTSTLFDDTGLTASTSYSYTVTATTGGGTSAASTPASATTEAPADTMAPTWTGVSPALTVTNLTSSSLTLTWPRATDNVDVVGYRILRGETNDLTDFPIVSIATQDVGLSYSAANLKSNTQYTFQVEALDASNNASSILTATPTTSSAAAAAPPAPPTSGSMFETPFSDTRIDLTWGVVSGAVGYQIYRSGTAGVQGALVGEVDEPASPWFSDNGLSASTAYYYTIVSVGSAPPSSTATPSTQETATTLGTGAVKVVRGPYVQSVTATTARIAWWTNIASPAVVNYGTTSALGSTASDGTSVQEHVVLIAGLTPGTAYDYNVGDGSVTAPTSPATFKTVASAGTTFSFDAMGDYGSGSTGEKQNATGIAADSADFLQTLGDNVYPQAADPDFSTTYSEMDGHFFKPMQPALSAKALWTANGNKEYYGDGAWFKVIWAPNNEKWYSYDWGDAHFLVLDSTQPFGSGTPQYTFAQADLTAHQSAAWRIVIIQDPPYSSTSNNSSSQPVQASLVPLFQTQNVQLVISGNSHNYERSFPLVGGVPTPGGITYIVSGNGGNSFNPFTIPEPSWSAARQASTYGHVNVTVSPTSLTVKEVSATDGSTLDSVVINAPSPGGSTYHALAAPTRIVDSRIALGLPTKLTNGVPQSFAVTGVAGIPSGATGITGNLTVTGQTALGFVALTTTSQPVPSTSTLNFPVGDNRANGVTTPLGAGGQLWAVYKANVPGATTQLVFDVTGYFTTP